MFDDEEWRTLVERLIELTLKQKLEWIETNDRFETKVGETTYAVGSRDNDDRQPFFLSVGPSNPDPWKTTSEIGRLESVPEPDEDQGYGYEPSAAQRVNVLRHLALRAARGAPRVLSKLLGDLDVVAGDSDEPPF